MKKQIIIIIGAVVLLLSTVGLSGCLNQISETVNPPNMRLTSQYKREAFEGANKVGYVDVTVKNDGGKGSGTVYVTVTQGSNQWTKEQTVTLDSGESTDLSFRFAEIEFWTMDPWDFTAWVD